jgi:hypothetical protein
MGLDIVTLLRQESSCLGGCTDAYGEFKCGAGERPGACSCRCHRIPTEDAADYIERLRARVAALEAERLESLGEIIPAEYNRGVQEGRAECEKEIESLRAQVAELLPFAHWAALNLTFANENCLPTRADALRNRIASGAFGRAV